MKWRESLGVLAAVCLLTTPSFAQEKPDASARAERHAQRREMFKKAMEELKQENADLQKLVNEMNSAPADRKLDAVVATVNKLSAIHQAQVQRMETMQKMMAERKGTPSQQGGGTPAQ